MSTPEECLFTCAGCGETFEKEWSDEAAQAECQENFPAEYHSGETFSVVCDDCYERIMKAAVGE